MGLLLHSSIHHLALCRGKIGFALNILYNFLFCAGFLNNICHCQDLDWVILNLFLYHEDGGRTFIRKVVNIYRLFYYTSQEPYCSYLSMENVRTSLRSRSTFTVTCVYRDAPPSGLSPCPLGSDFQVESIFRSTWKCRSGPIASPPCWEVPHHPQSKIFKTNSRPQGDDVNLPGSYFHFKKLEIPRKQKKEKRNLEEKGKSNTNFSSNVRKVKFSIANRNYWFF